MKKYLIFIILFFISGRDYAQTYFPFPDSNAVWSERFNPPEYEGYSSYPIYGLLNQDTIIKSIKYHKLFSFSDTIFTKEYATYIGGIREDSTKRIYYKGINVFESCYPADTNNYGEVLLYDFSVIVGDTIRNGNFTINDYLVVNLIDSVLLNNKYRKRIHFENYSWCQWIEGIGNILGLLFYSGDIPAGGFSNELICFKQNDTVIYLNPNYDSCFYLIVGIKKNKSLEKKTKVFPNPVTNISILDFGDLSGSNFVWIYCIHGTMIKQIDIKGKKQIYITKKDFLPGIYFYKIISVKGKTFYGKFIVN